MRGKARGPTVAHWKRPVAAAAREMVPCKHTLSPSPKTAVDDPRTGRLPTDQTYVRSEVRLDVVLSATKPGFQCRDEGILADLRQPRRPGTLLVDNRGRARNQRFFRNPIQIAAASFDIGAWFVQLFPRALGKGISLLRFN